MASCLLSLASCGVLLAASACRESSPGRATVWASHPPSTALPDLLLLLLPGCSAIDCDGTGNPGQLAFEWCARATTFTEAYAPSDAPSGERGAILTGVLPGLTAAGASPPELAAILRWRGYATAEFEQRLGLPGGSGDEAATTGVSALGRWWNGHAAPRFALLEVSGVAQEAADCGTAVQGVVGALDSVAQGPGVAVLVASLSPAHEQRLHPLARAHWRRALTVAWPANSATGRPKRSAAPVSTRDLFATISRLGNQHLSTTNTALDLAGVASDSRGREVVASVSSRRPTAFHALVAADWHAVRGPDGHLVTCARADVDCRAPLATDSPAARAAFGAWGRAFPAVRASPLTAADREALEALGYLR